MNAFDTTDPKILLELKRLEADTLLDVLRTINRAELNIEQLCLITRNVLRAQLGVHKMAFYYLYRDQWKEGMRVRMRSLTTEGQAEMHLFTQTAPVRKDEQPTLYHMGVEYVVPITNRGDSMAYFLIADFADSEVEAQNDLIFIATLGNILAVAIRNRQLFQDQMEQESLRRELEVAEAIQKQLLISDFSRFQEIDVHAINLAHHRVGGDLYDVIKKENGTTFACIADVAGKGIGAAMLMSNLQANLRALCAQYNEPIPIIQELNRILYSITVGEKFVTLFLAQIDPASRTLRYVNAGHNYPLFLHGDQVEQLQSGCILLGIMPEVMPEEDRLSYKADDLLFAFTDGVVEQTNDQDEMFEAEGILQALQQAPIASAQEMVDRIQARLEAYAGEVTASDDITMLGVKFL